MCTLDGCMYTLHLCLIALTALQVLRVRSCVAHSHAADVLRDGDLVLAVNGQPVTCYSHVESLVAAAYLAAQTPLGHSEPFNQTSALVSMSSSKHHTVPAASEPQMQKSLSKIGSLADKTEQPDGQAASLSQQSNDSLMLIRAARPDDFHAEASGKHSDSLQDTLFTPQVSVTICRGSAVQDVAVQLGSEDGLGTCRLIHWCGAMFQVSQHCLVTMVAVDLDDLCMAVNACMLQLPLCPAVAVSSSQ